MICTVPQRDSGNRYSKIKQLLSPRNYILRQIQEHSKTSVLKPFIYFCLILNSCSGWQKTVKLDNLSTNEKI